MAVSDDVQLARHLGRLDPGDVAATTAASGRWGPSLARHKTPRDVHFVDELPRNPTGKLIRRSVS